MFDFAWSEIALIGVVALVLIGPKDMPVAIKYISTAVKKARRMASEFQGHVDEMVRDADLHEVRDQIREIRSLDIRGTITRAVDGDGSIRKAFQDPMRAPPPVVTTPAGLVPVEAAAVAERPEHAIAPPAPEHPGELAAPEHPAEAPVLERPGEAPALERPGEAPALEHSAEPPAFIPPPNAAGLEPSRAAAPAFIPPAFVQPPVVQPPVVRTGTAAAPPGNASAA